MKYIGLTLLGLTAFYLNFTLILFIVRNFVEYFEWQTRFGTSPIALILLIIPIILPSLIGSYTLGSFLVKYIQGLKHV